MKTTRMLVRVHKQGAQDKAKDTAEVIRDYFDMWNQRVKIIVEPMEVVQGSPLEFTPYDIKIITADDVTEKVAHAVAWAYLTGRRD